MPKISVIVPVYDVEQYLDRCVKSILQQSYNDFEVILIDDESPDRCGEMCEEYATFDNRIHVIHRLNGGLSAARNTGIDWVMTNSNSEWISFIDSDDWIHPRYLELLYEAANKTGLSAVLVNFSRTSGNNPIIKDSDLFVHTIETADLYKDHYVQFITAWGKLYRKLDFQNIRYPEGKLHEDEFTTWKILFQYPRLAYINAPLYAYYQNNNGIMNAKWSIRRADGLEAQEERIAAIEKNPQFFPFKKYTIQLVARTMAGYIETLEREDVPNRKRLIKEYRNKLRRFISNNKKDIPFRGCGWVYRMAYPHLIRLFIIREQLHDKLVSHLNK